MLTLYFSGTGNTKFVAELFSRKMNAKCISIEDIEDTADFVAEINSHDIVAFCYPIYNSRVPLIMREFVHKYMAQLRGKKIAVFVTQQIFSGDGARVFTDLFEDGAIEVIYAEHFNMQQNMGNIPVWSSIFKPGEKNRQKFIRKTEEKINLVCENIKSGTVKKRGFSKFSELLGCIQGKTWQKETKSIVPIRLEKKLQEGLRIHDDCTACGVCIKLCPMKNLANNDGKITHKNRCTICYRCVNRCPQKAITVYIHTKPKWQYFLGS